VLFRSFKDNERLIKKLILLWHGKKEITKKDVEDFLNDTESNFVANKYLRFIKALFNFGIEMELLSDNPAQRIKYYPVHRQKKYIPPDEDVRKVLEMANNEQRMYLLVIINTLARVSEVNNLKWEDVHKDYLILKTRKSKNSNVAERMIPFNFTLTRVFSILEPDGTFVFKNARTGARYNYRSKFLKTLCTNAKVIPFGFHALRHYGATKLDQEGVALSDIQALLGHQQATTTNIYLQSIRKSLKEAVRKLDPPLIVTPIEIGEVR
jgi:integrase